MYLGVFLLILMGFLLTLEGYVYSAAALRHADATRILFTSALLMVILGCVLLPFQPLPSLGNPTICMLLMLLFLSGMLTYLGSILLCRAMEIGPNGIGWAIFQASMLFPFTLGIMVHGDHATACRLVGIAALTIGILAMGIGADRKHAQEHRAGTRGKWLLLVAGTFLANGVTQYLTTIASRYPEELEQLTTINRSSVVYLGVIAACLLHATAAPALRKLPSRTECLLALEMLVVYLVGYYFLLFKGIDLVTEAGAGAIAFPIPVGVCIIAFTLYSLIRLRERYSPAEWAGLALCTTGVIVIAL